MRPKYHLPINFQSLLKGKRHSVCDLKDSVKQNIHLIISTHLGDYRYDRTYGCLVWDKDFLNIKSVSKWRHETEEAILASLKDREKRLNNIQLAMQVDEPTYDKNSEPSSRLRRRIIIEISGKLAFTNEQFAHTEMIFFSPLAMN